MLDIDGVVVCGRHGDGARWKSGLREDLGIDPAALRKQFFTPYWQRIVTGQLPLRPTLEAALKTFAPGLSAETLMEYWFNTDARLNTDLLKAVKELRTGSMRVFFATIQEHECAEFLWQEMGLKNYADDILTSARLGEKKPAQAILNTAARITGAAPDNHLWIDVSTDNVKGAKTASWRAAQWDSTQTLVELLETF